MKLTFVTTCPCGNLVILTPEKGSDHQPEYGDKMFLECHQCGLSNTIIVEGAQIVDE